MNQFLIHNGRCFYRGFIQPEDKVVFVFGSNPQGRHGAGAALVARKRFGAVYGQGEGLQGNSYALPTKDLRIKKNNGFRSFSPQQIEKNIRTLYNVARLHPDKRFCIAYTNTEITSLNGYTGREMAQMFIESSGKENIPKNIIFSEPWVQYFE